MNATVLWHNSKIHSVRNMTKIQIIKLKSYKIVNLKCAESVWIRQYQILGAGKGSFFPIQLC